MAWARIVRQVVINPRSRRGLPGRQRRARRVSLMPGPSRGDESVPRTASPLRVTRAAARATRRIVGPTDCRRDPGSDRRRAGLPADVPEPEHDAERQRPGSRQSGRAAGSAPSRRSSCTARAAPRCRACRPLHQDSQARERGRPPRPAAVPSAQRSPPCSTRSGECRSSDDRPQRCQAPVDVRRRRRAAWRSRDTPGATLIAGLPQVAGPPRQRGRPGTGGTSTG